MPACKEKWSKNAFCYFFKAEKKDLPGHRIWAKRRVGFYESRVWILQNPGLLQANCRFAVSKMAERSNKNPSFSTQKRGFCAMSVCRDFCKMLIHSELSNMRENRVFATQRKRGGEYAILARRVVRFLYHFFVLPHATSPRAGRTGGGRAGQGGEVRCVATGRFGYRARPEQHLSRIIFPSAWCSAKKALSLPKK